MTVVIATIIFTLLAIGIFRYLPTHLAFIYKRATYYLLGRESASGFSFSSLTL